MKDKGLEALVAKSLSYYVDEGKMFGQKFPDATSMSSRRPADFWVLTKHGINHVECKEVTSTKKFYFDFNRLYKSGQYQQLYNFWNFSKIAVSWVIISFKNRKLGVDNYYIFHIHDFKSIHNWIGKDSIRLDEIEYYNKFEHLKNCSRMYIDDDMTKLRYNYDMVLEKISVDGVKGKIIKLDDVLR